jgi:hypothetical protein
MGDPFVYNANIPLDEVQVTFTINKLKNLDKSNESSRHQAINTLSAMAASVQHRLALVGNPDFQVLQTLRDLLLSVEAFLNADFFNMVCKTCLNLSIAKENSPAITANETGFLKSVGIALKRMDSDSDAKMYLCGTLWNLSEIPENKVKFMHPEINFLDPLIFLAKNSQGQSRIFVCGILVNMSTATENKISMPQYPGLLEAIGNVMKTDKGQSRLICCGILMNFSSIPQIKNYLSKPEFGVIPALLSVVKADLSKGRVCACGILMNLSSTIENKKIFGANNALLVTLIELLNDKLSTSPAVTAQVVVYMLGLLTNLSQVEENKDVLTDDGLGLVESMHTLVKSEKGGNLNYALGILVNLSSMNIVKKRINENLQIVDTLMNIALGEKGVTRLYAICILAYSTSKVNNIFLSGNFDFQKLFLACLMTLQDNNSESRNNVAAIISNVSEAPTSLIGQISKAFILSGLSIVAINLLRDVGPDSSKWPDIYPFKIIHAFMNFVVCNALIRKSMLSVGCVGTFQSIVEFRGLESRKAAFVIMNLMGADEAIGENFDSPLYQMNPGFIILLFNIYKSELAEKPGKEYPLGTFTMKVIVGTLLELAISDSNKRCLMKHPFLNLLVLTLEYFLAGGNSISGVVGGNIPGGADTSSSLSSKLESDTSKSNNDTISSRDLNVTTESKDAKIQKYDMEIACYAIETIFHLAFSFADSVDREGSFINSQFDIVSLMKRLLDAKKLPVSTCDQIRYFVSLFDKIKQLEHLDIANIVCFSKRQAIICNEENVDLDTVRLIKNRLDILGYDTAYMPDSETSINRIVEEVLKSHTAIIVISTAFKRSVTARFLATQIDSAIKNGYVRVIYVMVDSETGADELLTPSTTGAPKKRKEKVEANGWLGIMLGNLTWFSIYDPSQLEDIPKSIGLQLVQNMELINNKTVLAVEYEQRKGLIRRLKGETDPPQPNQLVAAGTKSSLSSSTYASSKSSGESKSIDSKVSGKSSTLPDISSGVSSKSDAAPPSSVKLPKQAPEVTPAEQSAWAFLHDATRVKDMAALDAFLDSLGVLEPQHLSLCDPEMFVVMISYLKPIQKKIFVSAIKDLIGFELILSQSTMQASSPISPENIKDNKTRVEGGRVVNPRVLFSQEDELDMLPPSTLSSPMVPNNPAPSFKRDRLHTSGVTHQKDDIKKVNASHPPLQKAASENFSAHNTLSTPSNSNSASFKPAFRTIRFVSELD